jgi:hypothetical protein
MKRALFLLALLALSGVAAADQPHAGSWKDAKITDIVVHTVGGPEGKGYVVITFAGNGTGTPNCASGYPRSVVIDLSTQGGAFAAAIAQTARLTGMGLTVTGTGSCSVTPTIETAASVQEGSLGPYNGAVNGAVSPPSLQPGAR